MGAVALLVLIILVFSAITLAIVIAALRESKKRTAVIAIIGFMMVSVALYYWVFKSVVAM